MHSRNSLRRAARRCKYLIAIAKQLPVQQQQWTSIKEALHPEVTYATKIGILSTITRALHGPNPSALIIGHNANFSRTLSSSSGVEPEENSNADDYEVFSSISSETNTEKPSEPRWNMAYRAKVDEVMFSIKQDPPKQGKDVSADHSARISQQGASERSAAGSVERGTEIEPLVAKRKKKSRGKAVAKQKELDEEEDESEMEGEIPETDKFDDVWFAGLSAEEKERRASELAKALLEASLERPDDECEEEEVISEEDQRSLSVGIIGAPNAGKSALTNFMVGMKVAAVSRKTNTTTHEVLGVMTKGDTQILFFDTPGLMLSKAGYPYRTDVRLRVESAWRSVELYDLLIVLVDVHRHLTKPDRRVTKLVEKLGEKVHPKQKRVLCLNKVDLVEVKKDLLKAAKEFGHLPGYEKFFMISGLKGSGVKDLVQYMMDQAVKRPWDEEPQSLDEEFLKSVSLEVVREKLLNYVHQEIPYAMDHRLIDWKEMQDGSLRIEQHFIAHKDGHRRIVVGKNGSKIRQIGMAANEELRTLLKRTVHLILQVRVK